jgi:undecaprenyl diphosphate synthase
MDGNGRWAKMRHLPRIEGHRAGIKSVQAAVESCRTLQIPYLTLYTFSVENWQRPQREIRELMRLLYLYLGAEVPRLHRNAVRLRAIGQLDRLPARVRRRLESIMEKTSFHRKLTLILALSYGGRTEILDAVRSLARERSGGGQSPAEISPEVISRHLYAPDVPPPDLLIRTSGEMRLSNFLLWEAARTRLYFTPDLWPDFRGPQFERVITEVRQEREARERAVV